MSSRIPFAGPAIPLFLAACGVQAQTPPSAASAPSPPPRAAPPAPAVEAGESVIDRTGLEVGRVQGVVDTPAGPMVVALIDGKLISLPQSTLRVDGRRVISSQTKSQMIDAAGAPR